VVVLIHLQHILLLLLLLPTLLLLPARCHLHILLLTLNITLQCTCAPTSPLRRCVWSSTYTCSTSRTAAAAAAAAAARYTLPLASAVKRVCPHLAIEALCVVIHVHLQHLYAALRVAAVHSGLQDNTAAAPSNSKPAADSNF
jgi:hypothetical protein